MRSRVTSNCLPTSSSVWSVFHLDTETHPQDLRLAWREPREDVLRRLSQPFRGGGIGRETMLISSMKSPRCESSSSPIGVSIEIGLLRDLQHLAHLLLRHLHPLGQLVRGWLATLLLEDLPRNPVELVDRLDHMHRNADGACLIGDGSRNRLPDPPGRVRRELVSAPVLELVHCLHQTDVSLLNQIQELQPAVGVLLRDRDDEAQVGLHHFLLRAARLRLADRHAAIDLLDFRDGDHAFAFDRAESELETFDVFRERLEGIAPRVVPAHLDVQPPHPGLVAREDLDEALARHLRLVHAHAHDGAFIGPHALDDLAQARREPVDEFRGELELHELTDEGVTELVGLRSHPTVLLRRVDEPLVGVLHFSEAFRGFLGVRSEIDFFSSSSSLTAARCFGVGISSSFAFGSI